MPPDNQEPESSGGDTDSVTSLLRSMPIVAPPSNRQFLQVWLLLGMQSFGGGTATLTLIHRAMVEQQQWVSEADFTRDWALVQIAPGINLLALTILLGRRVAGRIGIALALVGLLLPSVSLTILLTAGFAQVQHSVWVQAALRGVLPATVGVGLLTAGQMARALLEESRQESRGSLIGSSLLLASSGLMALLWHAPVLAILLAVGGVNALASSFRLTKAKTDGLHKGQSEEEERT